jgi:hypothetical protein
MSENTFKMLITALVYTSTVFGAMGFFLIGNTVFLSSWIQYLFDVAALITGVGGSIYFYYQLKKNL